MSITLLRIHTQCVRKYIKGYLWKSSVTNTADVIIGSTSSYCFKLCGIKILKRNDDFICSDCSLPTTIPWIHPFYINTCTSDNFLTIVLLYCHQNPDFLNKLNLNVATIH